MPAVASEGVAENVEQVLCLDPHYRYALRYDAFVDQVQIDGQPLRDEDLTRIRLELARAYELRVSLQIVSEVVRYVARERLPHVHPVREYLEGVRWDGVERLEQWLVTYAGVETRRSCGLLGAGSQSAPWRGSCSQVQARHGADPAGRAGRGQVDAFPCARRRLLRDDALDLRNKDSVLSIKEPGYTTCGARQHEEPR